MNKLGETAAGRAGRHFSTMVLQKAQLFDGMSRQRTARGNNRIVHDSMVNIHIAVVMSKHTGRTMPFNCAFDLLHDVKQVNSIHAVVGKF